MSEQPKVRSWERPDDPPPRRPYRDSVILHFVLGGLIVAVAYFTGGSVTRAFVFAGGYFVIATAWSWWRWRARLKTQGKASRFPPRAPLP